MFLRRGESVAIITVRAFVLSCIGLAVPAFGIYAMVVSPIRAQIYTRSVATFAAGDLGSPSGNATFVMVRDLFCVEINTNLSRRGISCLIGPNRSTTFPSILSLSKETGPNLTTVQ
jgi:hypothetical protein